jgi:hypothetical protein
MKKWNSTLEQRTPLKRRVTLRAKKPINKMSDKAKIELRIWMAIKKERIRLLLEKYGYVPCEYCKLKTSADSEITLPEAHHNDQNRRNNTPENCRILHRHCNQLIEDKGIKSLVPSLLDEEC